MKQGNQFYLEIQLSDEQNKILDIHSVLKVQFTIDNLIKYYDGISEEVTYDESKKCFKIWLTEAETFKFEKQIAMDARILFKNNTIGGTYITNNYWNESLLQEALDVKIKNNK